MKKVIPFEPIGLPVRDIAEMEDESNGETGQEECTGEIEELLHKKDLTYSMAGVRTGHTIPGGVFKVF